MDLTAGLGDREALGLFAGILFSTTSSDALLPTPSGRPSCGVFGFFGLPVLAV